MEQTSNFLTRPETPNLGGRGTEQHHGRVVRKGARDHTWGLGRGKPDGRPAYKVNPTRYGAIPPCPREASLSGMEIPPDVRHTAIPEKRPQRRTTIVRVMDGIRTPTTIYGRKVIPQQSYKDVSLEKIRETQVYYLQQRSFGSFVSEFLIKNTFRTERYSRS